MKDNFNRTIDYLRVSVTDLCNLRCVYCMSPEGVEQFPQSEILSFEEITRFVKVAVKEGVRKVRLTGGEPLVRSSVVDLVRMLSGISGLENISLTTNGLLLEEYARDLADAGLNRVNVSIDSLIPDTFRYITRGGDVKAVLAGLDAAEDAGLTPVKINMVPLRGLNVEEVSDFARISMDREWSVRFIEYMPTELIASQKNYFISAEDVRVIIENEFGILEPVKHNKLQGPAREFKIKGAAGTVAFISAISRTFCRWCNRLRLTSDGKLRACLLEGGEVDVRKLLRSQGTNAELTKALHDAAGMKPLEHGSISPVKMHKIGG